MSFLILNFTMLTILAKSQLSPRSILLGARESFNALMNSRNNYNSKPSVRVVTDIDDTVKSSGGVRLFGIPLGTGYVLAL
jgi:phosphatidate phosphatase APP1